MKLAVLIRPRDPFSLRFYRGHVVEALVAGGVEAVEFAPAGPIPPGCDLVWDPGLGMRGVPAVLRSAAAAVVATLHGLRGFTLSPRERAATWRQRLAERLRLRAVRRSWRWFAPQAAAVICPSRFAADEAVAALHLPAERVIAIHHGLDHAVFRPEGPARSAGRPFLLHVSSGGPKKNVPRLVEAYTRLNEATRPDLVLVLPGFSSRLAGVGGVRVIREPCSPAELAQWYRGAIALAAVSLHETFGMPILEAMACGCPVVTANQTSCPEVAGRAAVLVDPRDAGAMAVALDRVVRDESLRRSLRSLGLARAGRFDWAACGARHLEVFRSVLQRRLDR